MGSSGTRSDLRSIKKAFKAMERAGENPKKVWRVVKKPMRDDQKEHMRAAEDSKGAKWKPLASSTVERRLSKGGRAGKHTKRGKLKKSAAKKLGKLLGNKLVSGSKFKVSRRSIKLTQTKVKWAGIHQHGGRAGRGNQIPKREFFYISDDLLAKTARHIARHIATAFNKGG
jgi:phage gpG-like protein